MGQNDVFVAGIYPFGFHCVIYYIHTVTGIETYVLLRLFYVVQVLYIHYALLAFLKACCRTSYCAWGAVFVYVLAAFFNRNTYSRYYSSLPQEFGMIFILPGIYFMYAFLKQRKIEVNQCNKERNAAGLKTWKCKSTRYLMGFIAGFVGEEIRKRVIEMGCQQDFIILPSGVSRINIKLKSIEGTEINGQGPYISSEYIEKLFKQLDSLNEHDILVLAGSVPDSVPDSIYKVIMNRLSDKKVMIVVDASNDLLVNVLENHPFLIKQIVLS